MKLPSLDSLKSTSSITIKTNVSTFRNLSLFEMPAVVTSAGVLNQALLVRQSPSIISIFSFISSTSTFGARCSSITKNTVQNYTSRYILNTSHFSVLKRECFVHSKRNMSQKKKTCSHFIFKFNMSFFFPHSYLQVTLGCSLDFSQFVIIWDKRAAGM